MWVRDYGTGIELAQPGQVFEAFFTTKEPGKGTGLGLSISHSIVQEHGGWIDVTNEEGTCFSVYLPIESG